MIQSFDHVFDDPESIVHDGGANLYSLSPHGHEFRRIFPIGNASYGRNRQALGFRIPGNLRSHIKGNRLDCRATITSMGSFAFNAGFRAHRVEIDRDDGTDRIDQRNSIGASCFGCTGGVADVGDIGSQFDNAGKVRIFFDPACNHFNIVGNLPHRSTHPAF